MTHKPEEEHMELYQQLQTGYMLAQENEKKRKQATTSC